MISDSADQFVEPYLGFSICKPANWQFVPPQWSPVMQLKNASDSNEQWLKLANVPFCCMMATHDSRLHAYPTVQVTARPSGIPDETTAQTILEHQLEILGAQFAKFQCIEASTQKTVAQCRANHVRCSFIVLAQPDEELVEISVLSRSYSIFSGRGTFTVGMSSSADPEYFDEGEFGEIIGSVMIDGRA